MFGAFVRLTDSGLGCPDWPGCYGKATPLGAMGDIHEATQAMPFGPVTLSKAWIEMIHRYVGAILGMLIIAIVVMAGATAASWAVRPRWPSSRWWPSACRAPSAPGP